MKFFTIRYYREIKDGGELKKKIRVYRISPVSKKKALPKKRDVAAVRRTARGRPMTAPTPKQSSVSQRVYYINGKPTLANPSNKTRTRLS